MAEYQRVTGSAGRLNDSIEGGPDHTFADDPA